MLTRTEELEQINRFSKAELTAEQVYYLQRTAVRQRGGSGL